MFDCKRRASIPCRFVAWIGISLVLVVPLFGQDRQNQNEDQGQRANQGKLVKPAGSKAPRGQEWKLPKKFIRLFETDVKPAIDAGKNDVVYEVLGPSIVKFKQEQLEELEKFGKFHGIPSIRKHVVESHISAVEQGRVVVQPLPIPISIFVGQEVKKRVEGELSDMVMGHIFDNPPTLPGKWEDRELLFWNIHVTQNRLENLQRIVGYAVGIQQPHLKKAERYPEKNSELIKSLKEIVEFTKEVQRHVEWLEFNEAEFHLLQMPIAVKTLEESKDFKERLYGAYALQDSYGVLVRFYGRNRPLVAERPALFNDLKNTVAQIENWMQTGRRAGEDVIDKSVMLRVGTHWWLRGRYGLGSEANGLLKPKDAMANPNQMFGLLMPKKPDRPISRYLDEKEGQYGYDRRHFYSWAVERREMNLQNDQTSKTKRTLVPGSQSSTHFY